jgi:uncharacterized cupin superfamily protein
MPKIDRARAPVLHGTSYPDPYAAPCLDRQRWRLGVAGALGDFGVNLLRLPPGSWSSQRHWHSHEDEFVWVLEGDVMLVEEGTETPLATGDCAAFPAGVANGHHLINRSAREALVLEVGSSRPSEDVTRYPDCDLVAGPGDRYTHRDGSAYPPAERRSAGST